MDQRQKMGCQQCNDWIFVDDDASVKQRFIPGNAHFHHQPDWTIFLKKNRSNANLLRTFRDKQDGPKAH